MWLLSRTSRKILEQLPVPNTSPNSPPDEAELLRRRRFIWRFGVMRFGIPVATILSVFMGLQDSAGSIGGLFSAETIAGMVGSFVVAALVGGYMWGRLFWALGGGRNADAGDE
jgi:hypothetical protein